jgi:hypothetical protein
MLQADLDSLQSWSDTPLVTWWHLDSVPFTITFCILLLRKLSTHLITFSLILYLCILYRSLLCGTLSKVFIKSIYTESILREHHCTIQKRRQDRTRK